MREYATCIDPADVDEGGHGTHVAGIVAAARNGVGITGVAPEATIVNLRAGQDSGYFFLYETVAALTEAANLGLDVVNMSFYTDPWLYNCASADDYISGHVTDGGDRRAGVHPGAPSSPPLTYAHDHGVTLVAAAGNGHSDLALAERPDRTSPDYPPGPATTRVVTNNCLDLPSEAPEVISVSAVGRPRTKSDYSELRLRRRRDRRHRAAGSATASAPRRYRTPGNLILSTYPFPTAVDEGLIDADDGVPADDFTVTDCSCRRARCAPTCRAPRWPRRTSPASPPWSIEAHGAARRSGYSLAPDRVRSILVTTAADHACPAGGFEDYTEEGRVPQFNAICAGTPADNGLYGEGIVNAVAAVARR